MRDAVADFEQVLRLQPVCAGVHVLLICRRVLHVNASGGYSAARSATHRKYREADVAWPMCGCAEERRCNERAQASTPEAEGESLVTSGG